MFKQKKIITLFMITLLITSLLSLNVFADVWFTGSQSIEQTSSTYWKTVNYGSNIYYPIVLMGPPSYNGTQPAVVRVKNVTNSGFQFQLDEWNYLDGIHVNEDVDYMALDQGSQFINGLQIEAGNVSVDEKWVTVNLEGKFDASPVIIAQCVTYNGSDAVTVRIRNVTKTSFQIRLQEEEKNGDHVFEQVNFAAFEQGDYGNFSVKKIAGVTQDWKLVNGPAASSETVFLANIQTFNGSDTAAIRKERISGANYRIKIEEEQSSDTEVNHVGEVVGVVAYYN